MAMKKLQLILHNNQIPRLHLKLVENVKNTSAKEVKPLLLLEVGALREYEEVETRPILKLKDGTKFCNSTCSDFGFDFDTTNVTDMSDMFSQCTNLTSLDVSNWNTTNVTNMSNMFSQCLNLTELDLRQWDFTSIDETKLYSGTGQMFYNCKYKINFGNNYLNLPSFDHLFYQYKNLDNIYPALSTWDVSNKIKLNQMMFDASGTTVDISSWNVSDNANVGSMFGGLSCEKFYLPNKPLNEYKFDYCKIKEIYNVTLHSNTTFSVSSSHFCKLYAKNLGINPNTTSLVLRWQSTYKWGVDVTGVTNSKESIIYTLITHSFDRATAGYATCTITLHTSTKGLLTDEEIAQITAKGYTIA